MRLMLLVVGWVLVLAGGAGAADLTGARAALEADYRPYLSADFDWSGYDQQAIWSRGLSDLFAKDAEESNGEVGRVDFDPLVDGQDYDITKLKIGTPMAAGDAATIDVTFDNFETPEHLEVTMVNEGGAWKIDDIQSFNPDYPYRLRDLLTAPLPQ
jgi:hypothetical protein